MVRKLFVRRLVRNVLPEGYLKLAAKKNTGAISIRMTTMRITKGILVGIFERDRDNETTIMVFWDN